ncbi:zinc ribbon domain-containing protein [Ligilactobacillus saerimneri]|uniref:Zinc-ribbon domain-containing protein n=1 Tax=Ligilactobacillus saerimneri 30a TaxID=1227363 RepID=M5J4V9_9LACO|nr:zinc ribbon domain-containing protein [Ligilactobacillus saerimneri]EKW99533.1 hypothetical protein D271_01642 [Ligilactobacillus saerimneri 30a]
MKYCANCGAKLKDGAKFCTSCGQAIVQKTEPKPVLEEVVAEPQSQQPVVEKQAVTEKVSPQPKAVEQAEATAQPQPAPAVKTAVVNNEKMKQVAGNYWSWLASACKKPFTPQEGPKYAGAITLLIEGILFGFSIMLLLRKIARAVMSVAIALDDLFVTEYPPTIADRIGFYMSFGCFLTTVITAFAMIGVNYLVEQSFSEAKHPNFVTTINNIAHRSVYLLPLNLLFLLSVMMISGQNLSGLKFSLVVIGLMLAVWTIAILATGYEIVKPKFDRFYVTFVIYLVDAIIFYFAYSGLNEALHKVFKEVIDRLLK